MRAAGNKQVTCECLLLTQHPVPLVFSYSTKSQKKVWGRGSFAPLPNRSPPLFMLLPNPNNLHTQEGRAQDLHCTMNSRRVCVCVCECVCLCAYACVGKPMCLCGLAKSICTLGMQSSEKKSQFSQCIFTLNFTMFTCLLRN